MTDHSDQNQFKGSQWPELHAIVATARGGVIGAQNSMPWHLPEDLKRFKQLTMGRCLIMGRKTHESILASLGKPLPGRTTIVVSRSQSADVHANLKFATSLDGAIALARQLNPQPPFIAGGGEIYRAALPLCTRIELTEIDLEVAGDTKFPTMDKNQWECRSEDWCVSAKGLRYRFNVCFRH